MDSPVKVNFQEGSLLVDYKVESRMINTEGAAAFVEERKIEVLLPELKALSSVAD